MLVIDVVEIRSAVKYAYVLHASVPQSLGAVDDSDGRRWGPSNCGGRGNCVEENERLESDAGAVVACANTTITHGEATGAYTKLIQHALAQSSEVLGGVWVGENSPYDKFE